MKKTLIILGMVAALVTLSFFINYGGEYGGSDGEAKSRIQAIASYYEPWFQPLYEPTSGEVGNLLSTLQGLLDVAVIFCILGYTKGKQRRDGRA